jgi:excinuclease ABC subunit C
MLASHGSDRDRLDQGLRAVERALQLPQYPFQVECIDISNWDGEQAVGAIVVFQEGKPAKSEYRHYNIQGPHTPNDYAMMVETLTRRYAKHPVPQLLLVDGGRGQLQMALRVIEDLRLPSFPVAAIAKGRGRGPDRIYLPNRKNPLPLKSGSVALLLLQRIRDAAHRFGNRFVRHKMRRARVSKT